MASLCGSLLGPISKWLGLEYLFSDMELDPIQLDGRQVRLEPLELLHGPRLCEIGLDPELWKWIPFPRTTPDQIRQYIEEAISLRATGSTYPFVTIEKGSNQIVGCTRFGNIDLFNQRLEIGWTWITSQWQRSHVNTEAKLMMFEHAFEKLGCRRVEIKTDALNEKSRKSILRIGAKQEGVLRSHMVTHSGRMRDTVYFSILDSEWPSVKETLLKRLNG